jgi:fluoride ion exporter CrcB/FEX
MSTFSYETLALLENGKVALALGNVGVTLLGCILAVWLGVAAARAL